MKNILLSLAILALFVPTALAQAPNLASGASLVSNTSKPLTPQEIAVKVAKEHGLNVDHFLAVVSCESNWNPQAVGDNGTSFGLAQLHNPETDWGLTVKQAEDPETALETMATAWQNNQYQRWSCWNQLYG